MELRHSPSGLPVIYIDDNHSVIFSDMIKPGAGYKYLSVQSRILEVIKKERKKESDDGHSRSTIYVNKGFVCNATLSDLPKDAETKVLKPYIPHLKKMLEKFVDANGAIPYEALEKFPKELKAIDNIVELEKSKKREKAEKRALKAQTKEEKEQKKKERELKKSEREQRRLIREEKRAAKLLKQKQKEEKKNEKG